MIAPGILRLPAWTLAFAAIAGAILIPSCSDPVHDQEVAALGPENPKIPQGQYHRAGQPCTVCHGPEGPAQTQFALAGTVFWQPYGSGTNQGSVGANGAAIGIVDDLGKTTLITSNCVGNFWVTSAAFSPAFPLLAEEYPPGSTTGIPMPTEIGRAGSCGECHSDPPNYDAAGHIYLTTGELPEGVQTGAQGSCPVDPNLADYTGQAPQ
jgi:mono/diheme cytochrome c family protein